MDNAGYVTLTRQSGLLKEMQVVANNIANMTTTGYRRQTTLFAEMIEKVPVEGASISMTDARAPSVRLEQGALAETGGTYDMAIEGDGFFQIQTPQGVRLSRDGSFVRNADGLLSTPDGGLVLDAGGAPIFLPPTAVSIAVATDGSVSADGVPVAAVGLVRPLDPKMLRHEAGVLLVPEGGVEPDFTSVIHQGFVESSNVSPILELSRMIEVQRAYEAANSLQEREDARIREAIRTMGQLR